MEVVFLLLLVGGALCFAVGAFGAVRATTQAHAAGSRVNLMALGLLLWLIVDLIKLLVGFEA